MVNHASEQRPPEVALIRNASKDTILAHSCVIARSHFRRAVGLLNRRSLSPGEGLLLERCSSIHTLGMRFAIDAVFLDSERRVLKVEADIRPWRLMIACRSADSVLELPAGCAADSNTVTGDQLVFENAESEIEAKKQPA